MAARLPDDFRCKDCAEPHADGHSRCDACAAKRREEGAEERAQRRRKRQCLTCGAPVARVGKELRKYCAKHRRYYAERDAARRAAG